MTRRIAYSLTVVCFLITLVHIMIEGWTTQGEYMRSRFLLLSFVGIALACGYLLFVVPDCLGMHRSACLGVAGRPPEAPWVYRVLVPMTYSQIAPQATPEDLLRIEVVLQAITVGLTVPALYQWLKRNVNPDQALTGVLIFGVVYLMAYHFWFRALPSSLEILFVVLGLVVIDRSWRFTAVLIILASLNRETGLVVAAIYGAYHWPDKKPQTALLVLIWALITGGIHLIVGSYPHTLGLLGTMVYNAITIPSGLLANILFVPLAAVAVINYRFAPAPLKRLMWVAGIYVMAVIVGAAWEESQRLVLPVLPLILPLVLSGFSVHPVVDPI